MIASKQKDFSTDTNRDFGSILSANNISYSIDSIFYSVNNPSSANKRIYYISLSPFDLPSFLNNFLLKTKEIIISFKLVKNLVEAAGITEGKYGIENIGKVITLYLDEKNEQTTLTWLKNECQQYIGPDIPGCYWISNCIYAKQQYSILNYKNNDTKYIKVENSDLGNEFRNTEIIRRKAKGNILISDFCNDNSISIPCIVKEGRHGMWPDNIGRTMKDRLQWEYESLKKLSHLINVPKALKLFENSRNHYLAITKINGATVDDFIYHENSQYEAWKFRNNEHKKKVISIFHGMVDILYTLYVNGFLNRDNTPVNFMINDEGAVYLIDTESVYDFRNNYPNPPFVSRTIGFQSRILESEVYPSLSETYYSLGRILQYLVTGIDVRFFDEIPLNKLKDYLKNITASHEITQFILDTITQVDHNEGYFYSILSSIERISKGVENDIQESDKQVNKVDIGNIIQESLRSIPISNNQLNYKSDILLTKENQFSKLNGYAYGILGGIHILIKSYNSGFSTDLNIEQLKKYLLNIYTVNNQLNTEINYGIENGILSIVPACVELLVSTQSEDKDLVNLLRSILAKDNYNNTILNGRIGIIPCMVRLYQSTKSYELRGIAIGFLSNTANSLSRNFKAPTTSINWLNKEYDSYWGILNIFEKIEIPYFNHLANMILKEVDIQLQLITDEILKVGLTKEESAYSSLVKLISLATISAQNLSVQTKLLLKIHLPVFMLHNNCSRFDGLALFGKFYLELYKATSDSEWKNRLLNILFALEICRIKDGQGISWIRKTAESNSHGMLFGDSGIIDFLLECYNCSDL